MFKELGINKTEARQLARKMGMFPPRCASIEELESLVQVDEPTHQSKIRSSTQDYIQKNYDLIADLLSCDANCASAENTCTDAQAIVCFNMNKSVIEHQK
jgi:hypothetical protein